MSKKIDSIIGTGTYIVGDISFSGSIRIDGHVRGDVTELGKRPSTLILSDQARVEGKIKVRNGVVIRDVVAFPALQTLATSRPSVEPGPRFHPDVLHS